MDIDGDLFLHQSLLYDELGWPSSGMSSSWPKFIRAFKWLVLVVAITLAMPENALSGKQ